MTLNLRSELQSYGAASESIKLWDEARDASALRYVDLLPESLARKSLKGTPAPAGVVEHEERPLLYVYREDVLALELGGSGLPEIIRSLACRGEGHYLAIVKPGQLDVYPIGLLQKSPRPEIVRADSPNAPLLIADLAAGRAGASLRQQLATAKSLHQVLFKLITSVAKTLREGGALSINRERDEVLPLVGRAVFTRFLLDRGIINEQTFPGLYEGGRQPERAFESAESAARTCAWLDTTFNGELLTLLFDKPHPTVDDYRVFFERRKVQQARVLHELTNVMFRAPDGRLSLSLAWQGVDFAHVPVGLLSEVYEDYAHKFYRDDALRESVRYTPHHLAEFTISHAFEGLPEAERATARVLDPAAGAGIFLVLALQRLVREQWKASGVRPDTSAIRRILNTQIRGFDINSSALTLAALSLYLTALEVDPDPFPPEKLRFERLLGHVLRFVRDPDTTEQGLTLGSLGPLGDLAPDEARFSIVTGNPPWTTYAKWEDSQGDFNDYVGRMVRRVVAKERADSEPLITLANKYVHNDHLPDTAFLWRALEWAQKDGVIAFIVAGRLLFKRGDAGSLMREALLRTMFVTGVMNGALLLPLWPEVNQPFCIIFARNRAPAPTAKLKLVTPVLDEGPDGQPRMRIDADARQPISLKAALERPHLFKVLTRGGRLDVDIIERILSLAHAAAPGASSENEIQTRPIQTIWSEEWTGGSRRSGQGFIPVGKRTSKTTDETRQRLKDLRGQNAAVLTTDSVRATDGSARIGLRILPQQVERLRDMALYRLAEPSAFQPPQVVIREGFGAGGEAEPRARLYLGRAPLVVNRSFYSFSCHGHPQAERLAKLLFCVVNSDLFGYYTLLHSAKFGLERRTVLVEDIEDFPLPYDLSERQLERIERAADQLDLGDSASWRAMNRCINKLYGLNLADEQVIKDTLGTQMPYQDAEAHAVAAASNRERETFRRCVEEVLQPFFTPDGESVTVSLVPADLGGWIGFEIHQSSALPPKNVDDSIAQLAEKLAEDEGASRLYFVCGVGRLRVVIRNQYRYLTPSQARLCALDVLRDHGEVFPLPARAE